MGKQPEDEKTRLMEKAADLLKYAHDNDLIITIHRECFPPLAMRHAKYVIEIRDKFHRDTDPI